MKNSKRAPKKVNIAPPGNKGASLGGKMDSKRVNPSGKKVKVGGGKKR